MKRALFLLITGLLLLFAASCGTSDTATNVNDPPDGAAKEAFSEDNADQDDHDTSNGNNEEKDTDTQENTDDGDTAADADTTSNDADDTDENERHDTSSTDNDNADGTSDSTSSSSNTNDSPGSKDTKTSSSSASSSKKNTDNDTSKDSDTNQGTTDESTNKDTTDDTDGNGEKEKEQGTSQDTVTVEVTTGDVKGTILPVTEVPLQAGDSAMDVTKRILKEKQIQFSVRGSKASAYMEGIDNLYEFDEGQNSGWHIRVNGGMIDRSADVWDVESGDTINWNYTEDYTKDSEDW